MHIGGHTHILLPYKKYSGKYIDNAYAYMHRYTCMNIHKITYIHWPQKYVHVHIDEHSITYTCMEALVCTHYLHNK